MVARDCAAITGVDTGPVLLMCHCFLLYLLSNKSFSVPELYDALAASWR